MLGTNQRSAAEQSKEKLLAMLQVFAAMPGMLSAGLSDRYEAGLAASGLRDLRTANRGQMSPQNGIVQLVIIGATLIIGVVVYGSIGEAAPTNHSLADVQAQIDSTVASAFELGAIVPIVLVAVVILSLLGMFGLNGGGGGRR